MKVKIVHISDTHGHYPMNLPPGDILIHTGDYSFISKYAKLDKQLVELNAFNVYLGTLKDKYSYIFFTAGNHDWIFEQNLKLAKKTLTNAITLADSGYTTLYGLKFYGTSSQPPFANWAFNHDMEKRIIHYNMIPDNTDVLLTHCPAEDILDLVSYEGFNAGKNVGCPRLRYEVENRIKPELHCFGHIHKNNGIKEINGTKYSNACIMDDRYEPVGEHNLIELEI